LKIDDVDPSKLGEYDMLAVGAPTQAFRISAPMKEFLRKLENADLRGKKGFAFDTRLKSRFAGSAANGIEKKLKELGVAIIRDYASAIVGGTEGPLEENAEKRFEQIGSEIAKM
jgi:flavorubredoxin